MPCLFFPPTSAVQISKTSREILIRLHTNAKRGGVLIHRHSFNGDFFGRAEFFSARELMKSASIRGFGNFNMADDSGLEDDSGLKKADLELQGFESTLNQMSKWLLAAIFSIVILWKHDVEVMWAAMGTVLNSWLSILLKYMLNQERPSTLRSDPGMPSTHAQSIFFALIFALLSLIDSMKIGCFSVAIGIFIFMCGSYLSWLRVSQQLHTMNQVLVGAAIGSICGLTWFWIWHEFVRCLSSNQKFVVVISILLCVIHQLPHFLE